MPLKLSRELGLGDAVLLGLGSILGTGAFVSLGIAAEVVGEWVLPATFLAALVATFNGLSSAQLAAAYPVSGGTYEYGNRVLGSLPGFWAGWLFLVAKGASAATAALGLAGYSLALTGRSGGELRIGLALGFLLAVSWLVSGGIRRSYRFNAGIVAVTLASLSFLIVSAILREPQVFQLEISSWPSFRPRGFFEATALLFVAYTGYGRIATLGEEVSDPARTIPRAVAATLLFAATIYVGIAWVGIQVLGGEGFAEATRQGAAPLKAVARALQVPGLEAALTLGALTAMASVLLNLVLGLSRVLLAMARRGDVPASWGQLDPRTQSPRVAVFVVTAWIAFLILLGDPKTTWSFSAFNVLVYYALTNLSALQMPRELKRYPAWVSILGLLSCLGLAFQVEPTVWKSGLGLLGVGTLWQFGYRSLRASERRSG